MADGDEVLVLLRAVVAHRVTGVVGFLPANHPRLVPVIDREIGVLGGGRQTVIDYGCWIEDFLHPVGIGRQFVAHVGETQHVECRGLIAVGKLFSDEHDVIFRTEHLGELPRLRIQVARLVADGSFVLTAAVFRGDDDDPVCCTGTVDGTGGRILQYINRLDVGRVDVVDVAKLQSIYDEKWRVVTIRANTANEYGLASTGLSARFIDKQTGSLAFQRRNDVRHGNALDVFRSDFGNGSRRDSFLLSAIPYDDHFADEFGVFHQHNRQGLRVGNFFDLRLVTDEAENHFCGKRFYGQRERTIDTGVGAVRGSFLNHGRADERLTGRAIGDGAGDVNLGNQRGESAEQ